MAADLAVLRAGNALRARATGLIVLALLWNPQTVIPLYVSGFVISLITWFFPPAEAATIPLLVDKSDPGPARSLFMITPTIAQAPSWLFAARWTHRCALSPVGLSLGLLRVQVQSFE